MNVPFNTNDYVRVKLTTAGRFRVLQRHVELCNLILAQGGKPRPYSPVKEDAHGWSEWQLWSLMETFGPEMGMGKDLMFATNIEFVTKEV